MGILQIANHMVGSTFRSSLFFISRGISLHQICTEISECAYYKEKGQTGISLPLPNSMTMEHRWRVWRRGFDLPNSFYVLQPALQSSLTHRKRQCLNSMVIYIYICIYIYIYISLIFSQWTPIMGHFQWNERKAFSSLIEEHQRRKGDTRKMTTMKRKLKWFYWTGCILKPPSVWSNNNQSHYHTWLITMNDSQNLHHLSISISRRHYSYCFSARLSSVATL